MKEAILLYEPPYKRPDRVPIFPLMGPIKYSVPYFMYVYLTYYMDEDWIIPNKVWEKLYQQYMEVYEKSDWTVKEERRKLKDLGLIDYGLGQATEIKICKGLYADRDIAETLLKYREYRDSIFCLYYIYLNDWKYDFDIREIMSAYGYGRHACREYCRSVSETYQGIYYLRRMGIIDFKKTTYGTDSFLTNRYALKIIKPEKFEWRGVRIIQN